MKVGDRVRMIDIPTREMEITAVGPGDWRRAKWTEEGIERQDDFLTKYLEPIPEPADKPKAKGK